MSSFNITKESFGKLIAFFAILISAVMIVKWREYESKVLKEATKPSIDNIEVKENNLQKLLRELVYWKRWQWLKEKKLK